MTVARNLRKKNDATLIERRYKQRDCRSCSNVARPRKIFSRVATAFIAASVKYEYEGYRERPDKRITAQPADSGWRIRNSWTDARQMPCARWRQYRRIPFRLSARQHALRFQRGEGRRFQSANRKWRERPGNGRLVESQRTKENDRRNQKLE